MSKNAASLPDDVALCHQIIRDLQREVAELKTRLNQKSYASMFAAKTRGRMKPLGERIAARLGFGSQ